MELQEVLRGLLREFPGLHLAVAPEDVQWRTGALVRGPRALPMVEPGSESESYVVVTVRSLCWPS
jgi:hypothetical protein